MNNFMISAKRLITNKNTVTIIGVLIILIILYWGYKSTIDGAVKPVQVPIAKKTIPPQTEVTAQDIDWIKVPSVAKTSNVLLKSNDIVGKYTGVNVTVPQGSMFYNDVLIDRDQLPGSWLARLKTDANGIPEKPYFFNVNMQTTFSNSIQPDSYIDFYMKAKDEEGLVIFGKLIENIQVIAVKDGSGADVFTSVSADKTPSVLYFGLSEEYHLLMRKASYLSGIELIVVPHGGANPLTGDVEVSSEFLRDFIYARSAEIPDNDEYIGTLDPNTPVSGGNNQTTGGNTPTNPVQN